MSGPAAFQATVHGFRTIPSRGVVSITIEAPIEKHAEIARIAEHGSWVAVARLVEGGEARECSSRALDGLGAPVTPTAGPPQERERRRFDEMSPAQQAGFLCNKPMFWKFLTETDPYGEIISAEGAAQAVRYLCRVTTRADIKPGTSSALILEGIVRDYRAWQKAPEVVG